MDPWGHRGYRVPVTLPAALLGIAFLRKAGENSPSLLRGSMDVGGAGACLDRLPNGSHYEGMAAMKHISADVPEDLLREAMAVTNKGVAETLRQLSDRDVSC